MHKIVSFLQMMDYPKEQPDAFTTTANGLHYVWRGGDEATTIKIFNPTNEEWTLRPTTGTPPPGLRGSGCTFSRE